MNVNIPPHPTPQSYSGLRSSRSLDKPIYTDISYLLKKLVYISSVIQILFVVLRPGLLKQLTIKALWQEPDGNIEAGRLWDCFEVITRSCAGTPNYMPEQVYLGQAGGGQVHGRLRCHVHSVWDDRREAAGDGPGREGETGAGFGEKLLEPRQRLPSLSLLRAAQAKGKSAKHQLVRPPSSEKLRQTPLECQRRRGGVSSLANEFAFLVFLVLLKPSWSGGHSRRYIIYIYIYICNWYRYERSLVVAPTDVVQPSSKRQKDAGLLLRRQHHAGVFLRCRLGGGNRGDDGAGDGPKWCFSGGYVFLFYAATYICIWKRRDTICFTLR